MWRRPQRSTMESILLVFVYSVLSYAIVGCVDAASSAAYGLGFHSSIARVFLTSNATVTVILLFRAVCAGILLAYLLSYVVRYNVPNRIGQKIDATKRYGSMVFILHKNTLPFFVESLTSISKQTKSSSFLRTTLHWTL